MVGHIFFINFSVHNRSFHTGQMLSLNSLSTCLHVLGWYECRKDAVEVPHWRVPSLRVDGRPGNAMTPTPSPSLSGDLPPASMQLRT